MHPTDLESLSVLCKGKLHGDNQHIDAVSTDTRHLNDGELFIALRGERFDAARFLAQAERAGACAAVVDQLDEDCGLSQLIVDDTLLALGEIAASQRKYFTKPVIAITGSVGKTSCKEMLDAILGRSGAVLATNGNFNNEIGVPLTLFRLTSEHDFAVVEMGAGKPGDIAYLSNIVRPDVALVTTVAAAHLEGFGSIEAIAATKAEIYGGLAAGGRAVVNMDNAFTRQWASNNPDFDMLGFSVEHENADVYATGIRQIEDSSSALGCFQFELHLADEHANVALRVAGKHMIGNALAAAACAHCAGATMADIAAGLSSYEGYSGRMKQLTGVNDSRLIDDSYNANPTSMRAAIDVLASMPGIRILIMGDMAELGVTEKELHSDIGRYALDSGIDHLLCVGVLSGFAAETFGAAAEVFTRNSDCGSRCRDLLLQGNENVNVLLKGSRSAGMESILEQLTKRTEN
ncbi:MAG: UDP-N-acetylmuramoyl-tripeptide--D-alanyl-D-alanine ligase [Pseudomonadales bacterium]